MKKINFNNDWEFTFENDLDIFNNFGFDKYMEATGAAAQFYDFSNWKKITLPHDFSVALPKNLETNAMAGARPSSHYCRFFTERKTNVSDIYNVGWYRKQFKLGNELRGKHIFIEFEGVFRDSIVWVNGVYIDRHTSGYTSFSYEITDHLIFGADNSIAVRVDSDQPEGWWYEGAGIYRNVWLHVGEPLYFKQNQTVVASKCEGDMLVNTLLANDTDTKKSDTLSFEIFDSDGICVSKASLPITIDEYEEKSYEANLKIENPKLWDIESPNLYKLKISLEAEKEENEVTFGIRSFEFDASRGLILNGKPIKVRGACVHQDFAGVGIALTDNLNYYKIKQLKEMGVNAYRCSHHAPSPSILRACDELGMLVMDETRMFGTSPEAMNQLNSLIERDRNHPSVFIWCIGNEEFSIQADDRCAAMTRKITRFIKSLDKTNRPITYGANNGENFTGINTEIEVRGINYIRIGSHGLWVDKYHEEHPETPIIATEESSYVLSRGASNVDFGSNLLDTTGNVAMSWGSTPFGWMKYYEERPYLLGGFMWTGFDYRGEANPFALTNVSSSFGAIDLCGIPKPIFYYYQSQWTTRPVLKIAPHWNYTDGENVNIQIYTNCKEVAVYINGKKIGDYAPQKYGIINVNTVFEPGTIRAEGTYCGEHISDSLHTSGEVDSLRLVNVLNADTDNDISIVQIEAIDKNGNICHLANDKISLDVSEGEIVGVGNGDPAGLDCEQFSEKTDALYLRLFNTSEGFYSVPPKTPNKRYADFHFIEHEEKVNGFEDNVRIISDMIENFNDARHETFYTTITLPEEYDYIEFERVDSEAVIYVNGTKVGDNLRASRSCVYDRHTRPYRFYHKFNRGKNEIRIESTLKNHNRYPFSGYVKIEKKLNPDCTVRLHYGLARVFLKTKSKDSLTAQIIKR